MTSIDTKATDVRVTRCSSVTYAWSESTKVGPHFGGQRRTESEKRRVYGVGHAELGTLGAGWAITKLGAPSGDTGCWWRSAAANRRIEGRPNGLRDLVHQG